MSAILPSPKFDDIVGYQHGKALIALKRDIRLPADAFDVQMHSQLSSIETRRDEVNIKVAQIKDNALAKINEKTSQIQSISTKFAGKLKENDEALGKITPAIRESKAHLKELEQQKEVLEGQVTHLNKSLTTCRFEHADTLLQIKRLETDMIMLPLSDSEKALTDLEICIRERRLTEIEERIESYSKQYASKSEQLSHVNDQINDEGIQLQIKVNARDQLVKESDSLKKDGLTKIKEVEVDITTIRRERHLAIDKSVEEELSYERELRTYLSENLSLNLSLSRVSLKFANKKVAELSEAFSRL